MKGGGLDKGRSDSPLLQGTFLSTENALLALPSGQQLCRRVSAYLEGKGRFAITGVRNFRSAGSSTSGSMHVNQDLLAVEPEISPNWPRGNRDKSSAMQPAQTSSPGPVVAA